ncbi:MAG: lysophospholipid acyltransferase family protein [Taibaiella sp.]|nr:lysophospholipid acyltransferase family protein [Taibaiella sp.]
MQALIYYISLPFIYLISLLPFPLLYLFSDFVFFILYHVIGYRKDVVLQNLRNAFPNKTEKEILAIRKAFFHFLCDLFIETFKTLTISPKNMLRHCALTTETTTLFKKLAEENKSVMLVMGHQGNWEWAGNSFSLVCLQQLYVIYHPLGNKYFDELMYRMRTRFGTRLITMKNTYKEMLGNSTGVVNATAFIADQTPRPENAYWTTFLNQDTPVFKGTEIIACKLNRPIVYVHISRVKRGYYELHAEMLSDNPAGTAENQISELHTRRLERDIIASPETWLWSHRRWKHKRPFDAV